MGSGRCSGRSARLEQSAAALFVPIDSGTFGIRIPGDWTEPRLCWGTIQEGRFQPLRPEIHLHPRQGMVAIEAGQETRLLLGLLWNESGQGSPHGWLENLM